FWAGGVLKYWFSAKPILNNLGTMGLYATLVGINIFITAAIVLCLLLHHRLILKNLPPEHARHYLSLAVILVESVALYSAFRLAFVVSSSLNSPISQIFLFANSASQTDACLSTIQFETLIASSQMNMSQDMVDMGSQADKSDNDDLLMTSHHGSSHAK
ncbi:hypothetical protein AX15_007783, partial [Amanita polypyramis BW_CC]